MTQVSAIEVMKAMDLTVVPYTDGLDMVSWGIAFKRCATNAGCKEELTTDDDASRPITNAIVERKCAGSLRLRSVLAHYANRADERVSLFMKVTTALRTIGAQITTMHDWAALAPTSGMSLAAWVVAVNGEATRSGMIALWPGCLAKFETGCSAMQLAALSVRHHSCKDFSELFDLCQSMTGTEVGDVGAASASPKEQMRPKKCYNCGREGHITDSCPKPLTKKSYEYWSKKENVGAAMSRKIKEYRAINETTKGRKKITGAPAQQTEVNSDEDSEESLPNEYAEFIAYNNYLNLTKNKRSGKYTACVFTTGNGKSLARRAGTINGKSSHSIIFDSGAGKSLVSDRFISGADRSTASGIRVLYGGGDTERMNEVAKITVVTQGRRFIWWAYISRRLPFDLLLGEDFMNGRVVLDYVSDEIKFTEDIGIAISKNMSLPRIEPFPWGDGKPRAELLHRGSTKEEQDAVLAEELKVLERIDSEAIRSLVESYIHRFHEINKFGWVPSKWEPYELEFTNPGDNWAPVREYPYTKEKEDFVIGKLAMWKARGFADFSDSPFCLPIVCAPKPQPADEPMRAAINFQQTNKHTVKSEYKMPILDEIFQRIKGDIFSVVDGEEGYHKIRMAEDSVKYNSLQALGVTMSCNGMMEGMKNAGNHYQKCSDGMLSTSTKCGIALDNFANGYVDDTIIYSSGEAEHIRHIDDVLGRMLKDNVKPKWRKGQFGVSHARFGGRIVTKHGTELVKDKARILRDLRRPRGWKDVQRLYGMFLWHKKWIDHFDRKAKPITKFLSGVWKHRVIEWDSEAEAAYIGLCDDIESAIARSRKGPGVIHIFTDWSREAVAYNWYREHKGKQYPMGYGGRTMRGSELNWKAPRGELYAMAFACRELKTECVGKDVVLHTDHIAWSDLNMNSSNDILIAYLMDILVLAPMGVYVKGTLNTVADTITRMLSKLTVNVAAVGDLIEVPEDMRDEVLREAHEGAIGGHFGKTSMFKIIGKKYKAWPGISKQIDDYECKHCDIFKPTRGRYANRAGVLQAYSVTRPWELVGVDVEESTDVDGKKFSWLYIICFFTKFAEGILMNDRSTCEVIRALQSSTAWRVGVPVQLTGDDDPAFIRSSIFRRFLHEEGVTWLDKDANHHEGVIERGVATFKHVLEAKLVEGNKSRAALNLSSGAVNRGHVAFSTGFTPHSLVYGQEYTSALQRRIEIANKNSKASKDKMEKYFNKDKVNTTFEVGDKALIRDPRNRVPRGEPKFLGPFRIVKAKGHSYTLLNKFTGRAYKRNVKDLRRYVPYGVAPKDGPNEMLGFPIPDETAVNEKVGGGSSGLRVDRLLEAHQTLAKRVIHEESPQKPLSPKKTPQPRAPITRLSDKELIGKRIRVKWPDGHWYRGKVMVDRNNQHGSHEVLYDADQSGSNKEAVYENLTGNSRARVPVEEWELESEVENGVGT
jgi:hypothetical protein